MAAYRSARRDGCSLRNQARAVDETVAARFGGASLTGILGELDLLTGRLRYLVAGVPPPPLGRSGTFRPLRGGRRNAFGSGDVDRAPAEETLRPGECLVLHTDGVTSAGNDAGVPLGDDGLTALLTEQAAAADPPAEAVRRLLAAVVQHQQGGLSDDASILAVRWQPAASRTS